MWSVLGYRSASKNFYWQISDRSNKNCSHETFWKSFTRIAILTKVSRTIIINSGKKVVVQTGPFCFHCSQEGRLLFYVSLNEIHLFFCMHLGLILMQFFHQLHWSMFDFDQHRYWTLLGTLYQVLVENTHWISSLHISLTQNMLPDLKL